MTEPTEKAVTQVTSKSICKIHGVTVVNDMPAKAESSREITKRLRTVTI
jgi:hypothetical protein